MISRFLLWCGSLVLTALASAQPSLYLKQGAAKGAERLGNRSRLKRADLFRSHWILQFESPPDQSQLDGLARRGVRIVGYVPDNALSISVPDDVLLEDLGSARALRLAPEQKLSAAAAEQEDDSGRWVIEFHPDTAAAEMREVASLSGTQILEHPDLLPHHLLVAATFAQRLELAGWDEVAYIFPASSDLIKGRPLVACAGGVAEYGVTGQYVALASKKAWSADSSGTVRLYYHFGQLTSKVASEDVQAELLRALAEWSKYAAVDFSEISNATSTRTVNFLFGSGSHGDNYPFDGAGKTLAHTFYPSPPNPEPLAGDVHFDDSESWHVGADTDLYSVALHELGHALGLGHSDTAGTVMYPYYRRATTLTGDDIAVLRSLYAARSTTTTDTTPAAAVPLALVISSPAASSTTTATTVTLSGTLSGGTVPWQLTWSAGGGTSGTATAQSNWTIADIPLNPGANAITVTATDAAGRSTAASITVTRQSPATPPSGTDTVPPSLAIQSPAGTAVLVSSASITIRGAARDNVGVASVRWSTSWGASGTAQGTTSWSVTGLPLLVGTNAVTIRAYDTAGNSSWRSLVITRR